MINKLNRTNTTPTTGYSIEIHNFYGVCSEIVGYVPWTLLGVILSSFRMASISRTSLVNTSPTARLTGSLSLLDIK
jgi:hypothetical protein